MTLRSFLDAGYTVLVSEYQNQGLDLVAALSQAEEWRAGGGKEAQIEDFIERRQQRASADRTASQNDQSLQALQMMMAGATKA